METYDHWPCVLEIKTRIPQKKFKFENHWFSHYDFILVAINGWIAPEHISNPTKRLTTKCKNLRELKI
jgi:hypothetical protein